MNKLIIITLAAGLLAGCSSVNKEQTCATATAGLATYLAIVNAGGEPSADEKQIAAAATAFLTAYCGWQPVTSPTGTVSTRDGVLTRGPGQAVDRYGVPVIVPSSWNPPTPAPAAAPRKAPVVSIPNW